MMGLDAVDGAGIDDKELVDEAAGEKTGGSGGVTVGVEEVD